MAATSPPTGKSLELKYQIPPKMLQCEPKMLRFAPKRSIGSRGGARFTLNPPGLGQNDMFHPKVFLVLGQNANFHSKFFLLDQNYSFHCKFSLF